MIYYNINILLDIFCIDLSQRCRLACQRPAHSRCARYLLTNSPEYTATLTQTDTFTRYTEYLIRLGCVFLFGFGR